MNDLMRLATMLNDAIREVEEQRALVEKLKGDLEASRAALTMATSKLRTAEYAEEDAYRKFAGREEPLPIAGDPIHILEHGVSIGWNGAAS